MTKEERLIIALEQRLAHPATQRAYRDSPRLHSNVDVLNMLIEIERHLCRVIE